MTVAEIKDKCRQELFQLGEKMSANEKMQVAVNLNINYSTVARYQTGKETDVRNAETAEKILNECKKVMQLATA